MCARTQPVDYPTIKEHAAMDKTTKEILTEARSLITDPDKWTKGVFARTADHHRAAVPFEADATCWCAWGALENAYGGFVNNDHPAYVSLREAMGGGVANFNDDHTHPEVIGAFDRAIESCKEE